MTSITKAATKVQRAKAITEAGAKVQLPAGMIDAMAKGEVVIVPGLSGGIALTVNRVEQRAAKALASEGRTMTTPNVAAFTAKVHDVKVKGSAGIGGRADHQAMADHVAQYVADPDNEGARGWSAVKACREFQSANPGKCSWAHYRVMFADAVASITTGSGTPDPDQVIAKAKGQAMLAGVGYGQGEGGTFEQRFAEWAKANNPAAAKALDQVASERAAAKVKASERAAKASEAKATLTEVQAAEAKAIAKARAKGQANAKARAEGIDQAKAEALTTSANLVSDRAEAAKADRAEAAKAKRAAARKAKASEGAKA